MELWNQSLVLLEQIGDVQGKAATLHNMAGVIAQQGDVARAMELWNQSLVLEEQIGNVKGKAATLANMAWAAGQQGDAVRERELNLQAARALAAVRAWPDAVTVLSNLGVSEYPDAAGFLAQALWLAARVEVPVDDAVSIAAALVEKVGAESPAALLAAAFGMWSAVVRGQSHPKKEEIRRLAMGALGACAEARGVPAEKLEEWMKAEGLDDPGRFLPALRRELEAIVGDGWVFDPAALDKPR
jgi:tetratricopeptide (TPR) repeat protein